MLRSLELYSRRLWTAALSMPTFSTLRNVMFISMAALARNAPAGAAGLPEGDYYFQVTDPNGGTLLSTDVVSNRRLHVSSNGVFDAYSGFGGPSHPTGIDQNHPELGAITVRLANATCPADFLDSPNGGGVYKVWVTPVADFVGDPTIVDNNCGNGCYHGFVPSKSKTDNFKVAPTTATFCLTVIKQLVDSNGGVTSGFRRSEGHTSELQSLRHLVC